MRKTFNFSDNDIEILKHLEKQDNMSKYIITAIKHYMKYQEEAD